MTTNLYTQLRELFPATPLERATVVAQNADGTTTLGFPGGGQQNARGGSDFPVGALVFVKGGLVEGAAPALSAITIEV